MPDTSKPFKRSAGLNLRAVPASYGLGGRFTLQAELDVIAQLGHGMDARNVPVSALQIMGTNAAVYLAERTISGIVRRKDLYSVRHKDPKVRAEVEAWLWPLLPVLTAAAARAFAYGTVAVIFDWERKTLQVLVPAEGDRKARNRTLARHTHYRDAFEVHPDETTLELDEQGRVVNVSTLGGTYPSERAQVWTWDPEFGSVLGQGARRRAWRPYCEHLILSVLRDKYLERSVDSPRIYYVPDGSVTVDGEEKDIGEHVLDIDAEMRGGGAMCLPSNFYDGTTTRKYEHDTLEIPDRSDVWDQSLNRAESEIFLAYLVSSAFGGLDDVGGAASKTMEGMLKEHVEDLADWVADGLTRIVEIVHRANYDPEKVPEPEVYATDVGKREARKNMQAVLSLVNQGAKGEVHLRTDVPALLDKLGIPLRDEPPELPEGWGGGSSTGDVGRPRDTMGDREERRDDAATDEGEEDTGAPRDEDGEPEQSA